MRGTLLLACEPIFVCLSVCLKQDFTMQLWLIWPGTYYVDQTVPELTEIPLPLPPEFWDKKYTLPCPAVYSETGFQSVAQAHDAPAWASSVLASQVWTTMPPSHFSSTSRLTEVPPCNGMLLRSCL